MTAKEKNFFNEKNVLVTNTRVNLKGDTYSVANISSVGKRAKPPTTKGPIWAIIIGALLFLAIFSSEGAWVGVVGAIICGLGIWRLLQAKTTYVIVISSASGEKEGMDSTDEKFIDSIVNAINKAIIERG